MGGRDLENNTMEIMRRDTLEKETRSCEGIEEYVKNLLEEIQANIYQKALKYRNEHIVKVDTYDEFKRKVVLSWLIGTEQLKQKNVSRKKQKLPSAVFRSKQTKKVLLRA